ncbi:hypothetical protein GVN21_00115 [Caulobacter sp. SLTY]|uniref:hypothetical protein n=1 Tax=Caulobacter sp. SLTY TaxID=2683262 RepID=UPI00141330F2|nr:hypothetical protein [Caulobacter sp. SLTY]NBB13755.1 hypothetical protein [Caulobacter sp. SLTY]
MLRPLAILAAWALVALPAVSQAADSPRMAEFRRLCVETGADLEAALAIADRSGWKSTGSEAKPTGEGIDRSDSRMIMDADGARILMLGSGDVRGQFKGHMCALGVQTEDPALIQEVVAFAGVPAHAGLSAEGTTVYLYAGSGANRRNLAARSEAEIEAIAAREPVYMVAVGQDEGLVMIAYAVLGAQ